SRCRPRRATTLRFRRVPTSCSAVSLRTIGAIGTPRPGDSTFLYSRGRWKSGSAMAPRAVLDGVMWSSLTTSQARATRRAQWDFRGSVPLYRWAPYAGPADPHPSMRIWHFGYCLFLRDRILAEPGRRWLADRRHDAPRDARTVRSHTRRLRMPEHERMTTRLKTLVSTARIICLSGRDQSHWCEDGGSAGL